MVLEAVDMRLDAFKAGDKMELDVLRSDNEIKSKVSCLQHELGFNQFPFAEASRSSCFLQRSECHGETANTI